MARWAVEERGLTIRLACEAFGLSESAYRYRPQRNVENDRIGEWLVRLTDNHRSWGFGLCYLYLRNVKGFQWNHKRVYRIYRELELNLRIRPRKRLIRAKPEALAVPEASAEQARGQGLARGPALELPGLASPPGPGPARAESVLQPPERVHFLAPAGVQPVSA